MKKLLSLFFMIPCILFSHLIYAQSVPVIQEFSSIQLNEDETITVTPYHYAMSCWGNNCGDKVVLHEGEEYSFSDGHHAYGSVTYKGVKGNQLVFEIMSGFNAISFGGGVTKDTKEKMVSPYTKEQFSEGREKEVLGRIEFNEENKKEIARLINKLGIANELLWTKYHNIEYIQFLVENGADINYTNENGETILFPILLNNNHSFYIQDNLCGKKANILKTLIELGIDIHHNDDKGKEVLDYIIEEIQTCSKVDERYGERHDCSCLYVFEQLLKGSKNPLIADKNECNTFPNFEFITENWHKGGFCTPQCQKGQFRRKGGDCIPCNSVNIVESTNEECSKCPNRSINLQNNSMNCVRDYMFCPEGTIKEENKYGNKEKCASCSSPFGIDTIKEECEKCPNRMVSNGKCILKECPDGQFRAYGIMCLPCDRLDGPKSTSEDCLKCPDRKMYEGGCVPKICPEGTFRSLRLGSCVSCSESNDTHVGLDATLEECNKCPERELVGARCSLKVCPEGRFRINDGTCPYCRWDGDFETTEEQCSKCFGRIYKNGKCSLR